METKQVKEFYNTSLQSSTNPYEFDRWFSTPQRKAGYVSTRSAVEKFALKYVKDGQDVFELGPGPATWTKLLLQRAPKASYDLVDISEEMLGQAREALKDYQNINYIVSDILEFVPSKKYDFFFSSRIIEYVPDKSKAVKTIADSLQSGSYGYIVTKTPQKDRPFGKAIKAPIHADQIKAEDLSSLLKEKGCQIVKKVHVTAVFPGLRSGSLDRVLTKICRILPFSWGEIVSESYAIIFKKK